MKGGKRTGGEGRGSGGKRGEGKGGGILLECLRYFAMEFGIGQRNRVKSETQLFINTENY